jgi:hypothetical protein
MATAPPEHVSTAAVNSHLDRGFDMDDLSSDEEAGADTETTPFRPSRRAHVELARVRKQGEHTAAGTPEKAGGGSGDADTPGDTYSVLYKMKSNEQLFRVASDTGGSAEFGPDFINVRTGAGGGTVVFVPRSLPHTPFRSHPRAAREHGPLFVGVQ